MGHMQPPYKLPENTLPTVTGQVPVAEVKPGSNRDGYEGITDISRAFCWNKNVEPRPPLLARDGAIGPVAPSTQTP